MSGLLRVAVRVARGQEERARALLLDLAPQGFEERELGEELELAVYTDAEGRLRVAEAFGEVQAEPVRPGWEDGWRDFHRPVTVAGVWIGPPWEVPPPGASAVVIDPGQAFGTGAHATTRLCVELLATVRRGSLLDVGCGSGVLSIAGFLLGFRPVTAVDVDPVAVEVARANARTNRVVVAVQACDAETAALPSADVAVANVLLRPVESILRRLEAHTVITSGYLAGECPAHVGWRHVGSREREGWRADHFARPSS